MRVRIRVFTLPPGDQIAAGVSAAAVHDPAAIGGIVGTAIGAVLGSYAGRATRRRRKR